jgi:hypothetical protein
MQGLNPVAATAAVCSAVFWLVVGVIYVWLRHRDRTRLAYLNRLKHERSHVTREQFVAWFVERGVRHSVAAQAHDYLQQRCGVQDFPLAPDDSLKHVCDLDFDEDIADVLRRGLKRSFPQSPQHEMRHCDQDEHLTGLR